MKKTMWMYCGCVMPMNMDDIYGNYDMQSRQRQIESSSVMVVAERLIKIAARKRKRIRTNDYCSRSCIWENRFVFAYVEICVQAWLFLVYMAHYTCVFGKHTIPPYGTHGDRHCSATTCGASRFLLHTHSLSLSLSFRYVRPEICFWTCSVTPTEFECESIECDVDCASIRRVFMCYSQCVWLGNYAYASKRERVWERESGKERERTLARALCR